MTHTLGPLADLIIYAQQWQTQRGTYAGVWHPDDAALLDAALAQHTVPLDAALTRRMQHAGTLPGVRVTRQLVALLPTDAPDAAADVDDPLPSGIPIWHHGTFAQARITPVAHAIHLVRALDDYHEPTLAALRRRALRDLPDPDDADTTERQAALDRVAQAFLADPTTWRDVVTHAAAQQAVRAAEQALGQRLQLPGRTRDQIQAKLASGLDALALRDDHATADRIAAAFAAQQAQLDQATVTLVYQEQQYLQLFGIQHGRRVRRHLARGLHLVVSDQQHQRPDRIVDAWRETSQPGQFVAPMYYVNSQVPPAYAARKTRASLRLRDADAVAAYLRQAADAEPDNE